MKKIFTIIVTIICTIACTLLTFTACSGFNKRLIDLVYDFDYAWIEIPGGTVVEGKVDSWTDYEDGDQIEVTINGNTYLTDTTRCVLKHTGK